MPWRLPYACIHVKRIGTYQYATVVNADVAADPSRLHHARLADVGVVADREWSEAALEVRAVRLHPIRRRGASG